MSASGNPITMKIHSDSGRTQLGVASSQYISHRMEYTRSINSPKRARLVINMQERENVGPMTTNLLVFAAAAILEECMQKSIENINSTRLRNALARIVSFQKQARADGVNCIPIRDIVHKPSLPRGNATDNACQTDEHEPYAQRCTQCSHGYGCGWIPLSVVQRTDVACHDGSALR